MLSHTVNLVIIIVILYRYLLSVKANKRYCGVWEWTALLILFSRISYINIRALITLIIRYITPLQAVAQGRLKSRWPPRTATGWRRLRLWIQPEVRLESVCGNSLKPVADAKNEEFVRLLVDSERAPEDRR